eukprot:Gregarina_sp_Poly_1__6069@NODE_31_length_19375_cov_31_776984_g28_i0_p7_GENE_NODE_31_length_19375_cov_31_776984_g28_i0NODE_31_length_19375_cov_31_776984_g28_i0_p7_ORF_typecomplete_len156_score12_82_NODE_31_length_19375_cov_31_776984_g28_i01595016417
MYVSLHLSPSKTAGFQGPAWSLLDLYRVQPESVAANREKLCYEGNLCCIHVKFCDCAIPFSCANRRTAWNYLCSTPILILAHTKLWQASGLSILCNTARGVMIKPSPSNCKLEDLESSAGEREPLSTGSQFSDLVYSESTAVEVAGSSESQLPAW